MNSIRLVLLIFLFFLKSGFVAHAQLKSGTGGGNTAAAAAFTESNLPIVVINTNGQTIKDDPKIIANMGIIYNGPGVRNYLTNSYNEYNGKIAIEIRGSSSQNFPKKSYGFETRSGSTGNIKLDVSIFGMPQEHDWILSANYTDKSFCRNVLAYQLSIEMGHYASRTKYVDVVLNGTYIGIYVFMESIKRDSGRVDIANLHPNETSQPDITGGYILKVDKTTGSGGDGWTSPYAPINHSNNQKINIQYDYPSSDSIVPAQEAYIQAYVDSFEDALAGPNFRDSILGYSNFIGKGSWMDYFFVNELSKNVDGYRISAYLYKDKNKKLRAGPVWDYDIAWGNANYCSGNDTTGWAYLFTCTGDGFQVPFWWKKLLQDTNYTNEMKCRWANYRRTIMSEQHVYSVIDSIATLLNESKTWNFNKWPILGTYVWPNPSPYPSTYAGEIQNLKNWVRKRLLWLDANLPGKCNCDVVVNVQNITCNSLCNGQAIALGTSPYKKSFMWSNGLTNDTIQNLCAGSYSVTIEDDIGCTKTVSATVTQPSALAMSTNSTNATCSGNGCNGSASVSVSGGTTPYTYSWSNGQSSTSINSLCQGTYSVTVSDAKGCTSSSQVIIQNPNAPVVSVNALTGVTCNGGSNGSASVNVTGGSGPFTYSWLPSGGNSSSASGLSAGAYTVTVTNANGCSNPFVITIPQPAPIVFNTSVTNATCNGSTGSASVYVTGGTAPFTYMWSQGNSTTSVINSVHAGTYTLYATDNAGCVSSTNVTIAEPAAFSFVSTIVNPVCPGGSNGYADVGVTGGTGPYTYTWSSGATGSSAGNLSAGSYTVTVRDVNNCTVTSSVSLNDPPPMNFSSSSTLATCGMNDGSATVTVSNGTQPYSYLWMPSNATTSTAANLHAGDHVVRITDANGCIAYDTIKVGSASGLNISVSGQTEVSCYGRSDAQPTLIVTGGAGPFLYSWSPSGGNNATAANLSPGLYSVTVTETNGCHTEYQLTITEPPLLFANTSTTAANCYGSSDGILNGSASGGTPPYSFHWTPGNLNTPTIDSLFAGNYTVLVTDARGCTTTLTTTVHQPQPMTFAVNITNSSCGSANGSAVASVSGGSGMYNYAWSSGDSISVAENLSEGNYLLTVTDTNGCSRDTLIYIGGTISPDINPGIVTSVTCNGGNDATASVIATGGTGMYSYKWVPNVSTSSAASNLAAGIYKVIVTDAGQCSDSVVFIVHQPAPLAALIFSENVKCFGAGDGLLYADVGGGTPPYNYIWSDGQQADTAFNLSPGTYSLVLSDSNNCTATASGSVSEPDSMYISFNVTHATCSTCVDGSIIAILNGGVQPYALSWQPSGQTNNEITNLAAGTYTLCVTDGNNCHVCDNTKVNGGGIGVNEITRNSSLYVYPNPLNDHAVFAFTLNRMQQVNISIYAASGQLTKTFMDGELDEGEHLLHFDAADLQPGIYFYRFTVESRFQAGALVISR